MKYTFLLSFVIILFGCGDKNENKRGYDIYAVGFNKPGNASVAYWKNFEEFPIPADGGQIMVTGMLINGEDMYIFGQQLPNNALPVATYWKNGTRVQLSNGQINAMAISGSDVYAVGFESALSGPYHATYWKNGVATQLPHELHSMADGIAIVGNDVHIIGSESKPDTVFARYWKNDQPVDFLPKAFISDFTGITSSGSDIYITGYQFNDFTSSEVRASYWKNGSEVVLGNGVTSDIVIAGSNVYVAGDQFDQSIASGYWLNQSFHQLDQAAAEYRPTATHIVIAPGGDVIVSAWKLEATGPRTGGSILWINDEQQSPFKGNNTTLELMGIAVGN